MICLGIDTSNYTTSLAAVCAGEVVFSYKIMLEVSAGERGLRQSDALFAHVKNLPILFSRMEKECGKVSASAIGVSSRPRDVQGSYMPCFLAGMNAACAASCCAGAALFKFSHQAGHIAAALLGSGALAQFGSNPFFAFHLSGGTMELLKVRRNTGADQEYLPYDISIAASSADITGGQLIDRVGVKMGFQFPAGRFIDERACRSANTSSAPKIACENGKVNLSGMENRAYALLERGKSVDDVSAFVMSCVCAAAENMIGYASEKYGRLPVLFSGGVSSSAYLKRYFSDNRYFFAPPVFSTDNGIGVALLAHETLKRNGGS